MKSKELEHAVADRTSALEKTLLRLQMELEERRRVEERLLVTQFSVDSSADAIFWVRPDGSFSYWNKAACELLGYSGQDFLRLKTFDLNPEHQGEAWQAHWQELKQQGALLFETDFVRKDGSLLPVEISANFVEFNDQEYNCAFVRDLSERREAETALVDSNERFMAFMTYAPFYAYVKDATLNHVFANKKASDLMAGAKPEEVRSAAFFAEELARKLEDADRRVLDGVSDFEELEYQAPLAGKSGWLQDIKFPIVLSDGTRLVGGLAVDITERKQIEEKFSREAALNAVMSELTTTILMAESIEEMAVETLAKARKVTQSKLGYVGYIDRTTGFLVCPTMTHEIWDQCGVPGKSIVFEKFAGLFGWVLNNKKALLTNDPATDSRSTGTPPGHIPIKRFLSVPAFHGAVLVGQIALANSERQFTEEDIAILERMATVFALGLRRKQAEEDLLRLNEELEQRVLLRTTEIEKKKAELEKMNKLFVGRELRMIALKERIKELESRS